MFFFDLIDIQINPRLIGKLKQLFRFLWSLGNVLVAEVASTDEAQSCAHEEQQMQRFRPFVSNFVLYWVEASQEIDGGQADEIDQQTSNGGLQSLLILQRFRGADLSLFFSEQLQILRVFDSPKPSKTHPPFTSYPPIYFLFPHPKPQIIYIPKTPSIIPQSLLFLPQHIKLHSNLTSRQMFIIFAISQMNIQQEQSMNRLEPSQPVELIGQSQEDDESFGDLEDNAEMEDEPGQRIVIDEDTMQSNDLLVVTQHQPQPQQEREEPQPKPTPINQRTPPVEPPRELPQFLKGLISKLEQYGYNEQQLQQSYASFQAEERKYLEKIKIIYSRFLIGDKPLLANQFNRLRTLLYVPKYGESLVQWGNRKYGHTLTLPLALERIDHLQRLAEVPEPKPKCRDEIRLLMMLVICLLIIKLVS